MSSAGSTRSPPRPRLESSKSCRCRRSRGQSLRCRVSIRWRFARGCRSVRTNDRARAHGSKGRPKSPIDSARGCRQRVHGGSRRRSRNDGASHPDGHARSCFAGRGQHNENLRASRCNVEEHFHSTVAGSWCCSSPASDGAESQHIAGCYVYSAIRAVKGARSAAQHRRCRASVTMRNPGNPRASNQPRAIQLTGHPNFRRVGAWVHPDGGGRISDGLPREDSSRRQSGRSRKYTGRSGRRFRPSSAIES